MTWLVKNLGVDKSSLGDKSVGPTRVVLFPGFPRP